MTPKLNPGVFYGRTADKITLPRFSFTESTYSAHQELPRHAHKLPHYCLVLAGQYREQIEHREEERHPFTLLFQPADASHAEEHHTDGRHFLIEILSDQIDSITDSVQLPKDPITIRSDGSMRIANRIYNEFHHRDDYVRLSLEGLTLELLAETCRSASTLADRTIPAWLIDVKNLLISSFSEAPSLEDLSKAAGVHPVHLARTFRKFEGCTVGDFMRNLRIDFAKQKLIHTRNTLTEIALDSGFADHTHFSRSFKRSTGMTPSEFRSRFGKS